MLAAADQRQHRRELAHPGEAVEESVLRAEHDARAQDRRLREARLQRRLAGGLGARVGGGRAADRRRSRRHGRRARRPAGSAAAPISPGSRACSRSKSPPRALEQDADQADRGVGADQQALDLALGRRVPGLRVDLADGAQRLEEQRPLRAAGRDADDRPLLGQALDDIAADEARAAEHRHDLAAHGTLPLRRSRPIRARSMRAGADRGTLELTRLVHAHTQARTRCPGGGIGRRTSFRC